MPQKITLRKKMERLATLVGVCCAVTATSAVAQQGNIVHDAEFTLLQGQHADTWNKEDKEVAARIAQIRENNGGKPPNIIYLLIDDVGFGEFGIPELNQVRGYRTPSLNQLATEGISFSRMYSEPSCTPTRAAFLTGRLPVRSHMLEAKIVPPEGSGLNADEVTIAEVLSEVGYNTVHIGKWHQGDIEQAYPHNQGFDFAAFPMHNQATFNLMTADAEVERWAIGVAPDAMNRRYSLDSSFRPRGWMLGVEAEKGGLAREWGVGAGDELGYDYYDKLNDRYQELAIEHLQRLAADDKPFFLNYWPMKPVDFSRNNLKMQTDNRGSWVESMQVLDGWIGDLMAEVDRLGVADNTIIIAMGDNGAMGQGVPYTGFTDMVYRGFKGHTTEGGIRVSAFIRWPGVIEAGSKVGDMIHVSDLFTTLSTVAGASAHIPTDRVVDGIDQTNLLLKGDSHGRRDYLHVYDGPSLRATIKEEFKIHWPAAGTAGFKLPIYNLYRDPREENALKTQGMWTVAFFDEMRARHVKLKETYPDRAETHGIPYQGFENLRPETELLLEHYFAAQKLR